MRLVSIGLMGALVVATACGVNFRSGGVAAEPGGGGQANDGGAGGDGPTSGGGTPAGSGGLGAAGGGGAGGQLPLDCQGLEFDGVDDLVRVPDHVELDGFTAMTVEAWVYPTAYPNEVQVLSHHTHHAPQTGYVLLMFGDSNMQYRHYAGDLDSVGFQPVSAGAWHHVAASYDGTTARTFIDGVRVAEKDIQSAEDHVGMLAIGRAAYDDDFWFEGVMDAVRLSSAARYLEDFTPAALALDVDTVALWTFDGAGQTVTDAAGVHHGTLGIDEAVSPDDPARVAIPCPPYGLPRGRP